MEKRLFVENSKYDFLKKLVKQKWDESLSSDTIQIRI